jgi:hypothetical protein
VERKTVRVVRVGGEEVGPGAGDLQCEEVSYGQREHKSLTKEAFPEASRSRGVLNMQSLHSLTAQTS